MMIRISKDLFKKLQELRIYPEDGCEEVIWDLIEDRMELSEETKNNIKEAEADIAAGRVVSFDEIKKTWT